MGQGASRQDQREHTSSLSGCTSRNGIKRMHGLIQILPDKPWQTSPVFAWPLLQMFLVGAVFLKPCLQQIAHPTSTFCQGDKASDKYHNSAFGILCIHIGIFECNPTKLSLFHRPVKECMPPHQHLALRNACRRQGRLLLLSLSQLQRARQEVLVFVLPCR